MVFVGAAVHGLRLGAVVQVLSFGGVLAGLAVGAGLVLIISPHIGGQQAKTFVTLVLLLVPAATLGGIGRQTGAKVWRSVRRAHFGSLDAVVGAVVALFGAVVVAWLLSSMLVNSQFRLVSSQIEHSRIIQDVGNVMPNIPSALAPVEHFLSNQGFPQVYVNLIQSAGPVRLPSNAAVRAAAEAAGASTLKVVAIGCGQIQEGSGFVAAPGLVVTNAHVVAGTRTVNVEDSQRTYQATVVLFDPEFDLAVLRIPGLPDRPLSIDAGDVGRGTRAAVLGYPGGGPFTAVSAGVVQQFEAVGLDIYGQQTTSRSVYEIEAVVRPGNSGGPLVETNGTVIGVVFSRSVDNGDIGYALTTPGVLQRVHAAEKVPAADAVATGACISG